MDEQMRVTNNGEALRYEVHVAERLAGFAEYRASPGHLVFTHTVVLPEFEGRGVGRRLAAGALDDVRSRSMTMTPQCPFIAAYVRRHPEYSDLVGEAPSSASD